MKDLTYLLLAYREWSKEKQEDFVLDLVALEMHLSRQQQRDKN